MPRSVARVAARPIPPGRPVHRRSPATALLARITSGLVLRGLLFIAIFSLAAVPPTDPDLWWHLSNGRLMVATASIPHADVYSFSAAGQPWVMHEWLADLGMYGLDRLGGLPLLVATFALIVTAAAACLYWLLRRSGLQPVPSVVLTLVGALAGSTAWGARPQLLNLMLAGVLLVGLRLYREGRLSPWLLPPFIGIWANLHSAFVVGIIMVGLFWAGQAFDRRRGDETAISGARLRDLAFAIGGSLVLAMVNPFGIQALLFAVGTLTSPLIQGNIQEWASPDFHSLAGLLFEAIVVLMLIGLATRRVRLATSDWLLALGLLYLGFSSQRHVPLFVLAAAPLYGRCAQALLERVRRPSPVRRRLAANRGLAIGVANLGLLLVAGAGMIAYRALPNLQPAQQRTEVAGALPVAATAALQSLGQPVRVFDYYDYGGYLIWTLYPAGGRVFIDGRVEVYGPKIFADYLRVNYLADGWDGVLTGARPDAIVIPSGHPLVSLLLRDPSWRQFHRDRVATVFTRVGFAP